MFARKAVLSLAFSCLYGNVAALDLDINSRDSIVDAAKTLASGIVKYYNASVSESGIPGVFPDDYYWWEAGIVLDGLIGYSSLTGDKQYDSLVSEGIQWQRGKDYAFMARNQTASMTNDDHCAWGQTAMSAAEFGFPKPENGSWVDAAISVFDVMTMRWSTEFCDGGLSMGIYSFQVGSSYKQTASNGNFFLLASRLARFTGNGTYTEWAEKIFDWAHGKGFVTDDYQIYDGADGEQNCTEFNEVQFTYNHGLFTEGAAILYNITDGKQKWADAVEGFVNSTSRFVENDVLVETACENNGKCGIDHRAFKGVAARSYARAAVAAPTLTGPLTLMLEKSAKGAAKDCSKGQGETGDVACSLSWVDQESMWEYNTASDGNLGEVFSAMEVVQGLLYSQTKIQGSNVTGSPVEEGEASKPSDGAGSEGTGAAGAAGTMTASITVVLAAAFAAALLC
ncbi:glycoside hydrolase family 76 protein [Bipolaris victoriae FI3]|uniref:Mannan endo-1,6-alpha-mannosidase n=1 Tax=Bipolaris victoriae (strain FI3) TaxID=930091 RepID=W7EMV8_BIPV3|nr:glycoside hydrolase family 76 protein [Bipolaris victoriae FI3]